MDLSELEFIRDFRDYLDFLQEDFLDLHVALEIDEGNVYENETLQKLLSLIIGQNHTLLKLMTKMFEDFKSKVDRKYWSEWKKGYPHINEDYDTHNSGF
jgi:hypothetical protein